MLSLFCSAALLTSTQSAPDVAIMIHGAGGGGWEYRFWKPVFEKAKWKVIDRDLMPTKKGLTATTFDDYLSQVVNWVPKNRGKVVVIGASLGGILALKSSEQIKPDAVILINGVPPLAVGEGKAKSDTIPEILRWANGPIKDTRDAMPDSDEATIQWAHPQWRDESGAVIREVRAGIKTAPPQCPVLVIIGTDDTDILPSDSRATAAWAKADVFEYSATSHVGPLMGRRAKEIAEDATVWVKNRLAKK